MENVFLFFVAFGAEGHSVALTDACQRRDRDYAFGDPPEDSLILIQEVSRDLAVVIRETNSFRTALSWITDEEAVLPSHLHQRPTELAIA